MAIINDCEFCNWVSNTPNATYTKQTEFYDGIDGLEDIQMCWRCGEVAKFERDRIIKLLEAQCERPLDPKWEHHRESCSCWQLALIKGEQK